MSKNNVFKASALLFILAVTVSCNSGAASFNGICTIYERVVQKKVDLSTKESMIVKGIQNEFPKFFKDNFQHIMYVDADKRYRALKRAIELNTENTWECEAAREYYATEFK